MKMKKMDLMRKIADSIKDMGREGDKLWELYDEVNCSDPQLRILERKLYMLEGKITTAKSILQDIEYLSS
jgi:hypothetical protein